MQAAFNDHQTGDNGENDFGFGIDMNDLDVNPNDNDNELELGDLNDIFDSDPFASSGGGGTSPTGDDRNGGQMSQPGSPRQQGSDPSFRSVETKNAVTQSVLQSASCHFGCKCIFMSGCILQK